MPINRLLSAALKLAVAATLLYLVVSNTDVDRVTQVVLAVRPEAIIAAIFLHVLGYSLGGLRWWLCTRHTGLDYRFFTIFPSYYLGVFFNNFLPTGVGGDLVRILHLQRGSANLTNLVNSAVSDRLIGISVVFATGLTALSLSSDIHLDESARFLLIVLAVAAIASIWVLGSDWFGMFLSRLAERHKRTRIRRKALETIQSLHALRERKGMLLAAIGLSLSVQFLVIVSYYLLAKSLGLELPLLTYFVIVPIVFLAASMPISVGGLGLREGTLVVLLITVGADKTLAVSLSVVYLAVLWISSLPGALVLLFGSRPQPAS